MFRDDINVNAVMMEHGISATAARVLFEINRLVIVATTEGKKDSTGTPFCDVGCIKLGQMIGKSRRTIERAIAELKTAGLIYVKRVGLGHNDRIYMKGMEG